MFKLDNLKVAIEKSSFNSTAHSILKYLEQGQVEAAKQLYHFDGDKISNYDLIQEAVDNLLGCRTHNEFDCQSWICKELNESRKQRIKENNFIV